MLQELIVTRETAYGIRLNRLVKITTLCHELYGEENGTAIINEYMQQLYSWLKRSIRADVYHDLNHIFAMTLNADKLAIGYKCDIQSRRRLFLACMFHDVFHSFGYLPDSANVGIAISKFIESHIRLQFCAKDDTLIISDIIFCTVFPFRVPADNLLQKIARMADLTMCFEEDVEFFAKGLGAEFKNQGKNIIVTPTDMLEFTQTSEYIKELNDYFG